MLKKTSTCFAITTILFTGCSSQLAVLQQDRNDNAIALHELRSELADLKHALNNTQVELQILDEQVKTQEVSLKKTKTTSSENKNPSLEKRLLLIEHSQEKIQADLKQISSHANQTTSCLSQYSAKIAELEQNIQHQHKLIAEALDLKSSFKNLASSLKTDSSEEIYKVKAGDSLEKIARMHKVSVESLKKENQLSNPKILIGQELRIPHEN